MLLLLVLFARFIVFVLIDFDRMRGFWEREVLIFLINFDIFILFGIAIFPVVPISI